MAQQMVNGSRHDGSVTITQPMSRRYAVVGTPDNGLHHQRKPNRHGKAQPHWNLSDLAHGIIELPHRK